MFSEDEFRQLFECFFIDDTASVFRFSDLEKCLGDRAEWKEFKPDDEALYRPAWIGYDPTAIATAGTLLDALHEILANMPDDTRRDPVRQYAPVPTQGKLF